MTDDTKPPIGKNRSLEELLNDISAWSVIGRDSAPGILPHAKTISVKRFKPKLNEAEEKLIQNKAEQKGISTQILISADKARLFVNSEMLYLLNNEVSMFEFPSKQQTPDCPSAIVAIPPTQLDEKHNNRSILTLLGNDGSKWSELPNAEKGHFHRKIPEAKTLKYRYISPKLTIKERQDIEQHFTAIGLEASEYFIPANAPSDGGTHIAVALAAFNRVTPTPCKTR